MYVATIPENDIIMLNRWMQVIEGDRKRILAIERLVLETICFNFNTRMSFSFVIKVGKGLGGKISSRRRVPIHLTFCQKLPRTSSSLPGISLSTGQALLLLEDCLLI